MAGLYLLGRIMCKSEGCNTCSIASSKTGSRFQLSFYSKIIAELILVTLEPGTLLVRGRPAVLGSLVFQLAAPN